MTARLDPVHQFMVLLTELSHELTGLWVFHHASTEKLAAMDDSDDWVAEELEYLDAKEFRKVKYGAVFSFRDYLRRVTIGALAIIFESVSISVKEVTGRKVDLWSSEWDALPYVLDARKLTSLHNVLKHNRGVIRRASSTSSRFLVDKCGLQDGTRVDSIQIDLAEQIFRAYSFLVHLVSLLTGVRPPVLRGSERKLRSAFHGSLPSFTAPKRRRRTPA